MKTDKKIMFLLMFVLIQAVASAKIWRVNNTPGISADYTQLSDASSSTSVLSSDTIYVEGTATRYSDATFTKKVTIIGTGYFLNQNPETQANLQSSKVGSISFNTGSEGSVLMGVDLGENILYINAHNITIKRNKLNAILQIGNTYSNIIILQNFIQNTYTYNSISIGNNCNNIIIQNNYIKAATYNTAISMSSSSDAQIQNNVIDGDITIYNSQFFNNILISGTFVGSGNVFSHNLCNSNQLNPDSVNLQNIDMATVFDNTQTSADGKFKLKAGSPAIGYGLTGIDCGMYGGSNPYILSGLPDIPSIYFFFAPASASPSSGLPVNIKVKSNK